MTRTDVEIAAVNGAGNADAGVAHGAHLLAFTEAVMRGGSAAEERTALHAALSNESFIEVAAVIGSFNVVDRIADATGIPLDAVLRPLSREIRDQLNLARFASAANTPVD